jgi:hypothetical protein
MGFIPLFPLRKKIFGSDKENTTGPFGAGILALHTLIYGALAYPRFLSPAMRAKAVLIDDHLQMAVLARCKDQFSRAL